MPTAASGSVCARHLGRPKAHAFGAQLSSRVAGVRPIVVTEASHVQARPARRVHFRTQSVDLGQPRTGSVDNVADVLAIAEGEAFK